MSIEQEKMIVESLSSLYPLQEFEEKAIHTVLDALPPAEPKTGKWVDTGSNEEWYAKEYECSECGGTMLGEANFCPNCGAMMEVTT